MIEAATTNAAVTAMRSASEEEEGRGSGDIIVMDGLDRPCTTLSGAALDARREAGDSAHARLSFTSTGGPLLMV